MQVLEAKYEIVTPMFIGGANQTDTPDIRPPSIKGALRFWWRALQWGACLKDKGGDEAEALKFLHQQEAELFGAAAKDDQFGQGVCLIKLKQPKSLGIEKNWPTNNDAGAGFLGYGLDATNDNPHRIAVNQKQQFSVCVTLKRHITAEQIQQLTNTLIFWGLLGGLGSRSRRGFGSVAIKNLNDQVFDFKDSESYIKTIKELIAPIHMAPGMPIYTAFNDAMQIAKAGQANDQRRLMNQLGGQYREARKQAGPGLAKLPFGLPLAGNRGEADETNRRSGPLFMHIHPVGSEYQALITFIPAHFHPEYPQGNQIEFYQQVLNYMNSLEKVYP